MIVIALLITVVSPLMIVAALLVIVMALLMIVVTAHDRRDTALGFSDLCM